MNMTRHNFFLPDRQINSLKQVAEVTSLTTAELLRRLIDHGLQERSLNEVVPNMSGYLSKGLV